MISHILTTPGIILKTLSEKDSRTLFELRSDPEVNRYIDRDPPQDESEVIRFIRKVNEGTSQGVSYYKGIFLAGSEILIGTICLWNFSSDRKTAEIGFELLPSFQGKGYMHEAIELVFKIAFCDFKFEQVTAWTHKQNHRSHKLLESKGFSRDLRSEENIQAQEENMVIYKRSGRNELQ